MTDTQQNKSVNEIMLPIFAACEKKGVYDIDLIVDDIRTALTSALQEGAKMERERIAKIIYGNKQVDPHNTTQELPHEESCCNETLDDVLAQITPTEDKKYEHKKHITTSSPEDEEALAKIIFPHKH